jgi:hypothetical protein
MFKVLITTIIYHDRLPFAVNTNVVNFETLSAARAGANIINEQQNSLLTQRALVL